MPRFVPGKAPGGPTGALVGGLLLLALVCAGSPAAAAPTLGAVTGEGHLFRTPGQLQAWADELGRAQNESVAIRVFDNEEQLVDWLIRYRQIEFALLSRERLQRVPAGQLTLVRTGQELSADNPRAEQLVAGPQAGAAQIAGFRAAARPLAPVAPVGERREPAAAPPLPVPTEPAATAGAAEGDAPAAAAAAEPEALIVNLRVNHADRGTFVIYRDGGEFFVRTEELRAMGLVALPPARRSIAGEEYTPLGAIAGAAARLDEAAAELLLDLPPTVFAESRIDFRAPRPAAVLRPRDDSQFVNYGVEYRAAGEALEADAFRWTGELGGRFGDYLLLTDGFYDDEGADRRFVRLQTRVIRDDREALRRYTAGDLVAHAGRFASRLPLGGVGIARAFSIDPYYIENPMYGFSGLASLPTTLEVLVDGQRIRTEQLAPGPFAVENLWQTLGARNVELVLRDALGREIRVDSPYYFSNRLLRRGVHDYSYNLGLLRRDYGVESADYADPVWSAFHRYGTSDDLTLGVQTEGGDGLGTLGGSVLGRLGPWGTFDLEVAGSHAGGRQGAAGFAGYEFQARDWRWQVAANLYTPDFANLDNRHRGGQARADLSASIGYISRSLGSATLSYVRSDGRSEADREQLSASYFRNLGRQLSLSLNYTRSSQAEDEFYARLTYYFERHRDVAFAADSRHTASTDSQNLELTRTTPTGEGIGWRAVASRVRDEAGEAAGFAPFVQYNAPFGIYRGEYSVLEWSDDRPDEQTLLLSATGGMAHVDGKLGISRPIRDSFGLVRVGDVEGVRVYVNNQPVGRTGPDGTVFVPELNSYFENQISIENEDVPLDYLMAVTRRDVSPPLRSGSCIDFPTQRYQSFWGKLEGSADGQPLDLAFVDCVLETAGGTVTFTVDGAGSFFFDTTDLGKRLAVEAVGCDDAGPRPGRSLAGPAMLRCRLDAGEAVCPFEVPVSTEPAVDLGLRACRATLTARE